MDIGVKEGCSHEQLDTDHFLNVVCDHSKEPAQLFEDSVTKLTCQLIQLRRMPYFSPRERSWSA